MYIPAILKRFFQYLLNTNTTLYRVDTDRMEAHDIKKGDVLLVDNSCKPGKNDIGVNEKKELEVGKGKGKVVCVVRER